MSLHLEFEPHSWYMGFAIRDNLMGHKRMSGVHKWTGYTANGNTYQVDEVDADTLKELKEKIRNYHKWIEERDKYNRRMLGEEV